MFNSIKLSIFKGIGSEDTNQFQFVVNVVCTGQQIIDDNINKVHLVTALEDRALTWYIKYCVDHPLAMLANTKDALKKS